MSAVPERRQRARRAPAPDEPIARMRMRAGPELSAVDVSDAGVLVEGATRLLPGTRMDVHVITPDGRVLVRGRVVRAHVHALRPDRMAYRAGIAFDRLVNTGIAVAR